MENKNTKIGIRGSFFIGAICNDGIIIAAESRGNIFDKRDDSKTPLAYFDDIQKIFPIEKKCIAETGQELIGNYFFSHICREFYRRTSPKIPIDDLLPEFIQFCERHMLGEIFQELKNQKLIAAGYKNDLPTLCYFDINVDPNFKCINNGLIESDITLLKGYDTGDLSCKEVAELAEKAIQEYASINDRWKTIGGPISILKITVDNIEWVKNEPTYNEWTKSEDFIEDYQKGMVEITPIPPFDKEQLDEFLGIK